MSSLALDASSHAASGNGKSGQQTMGRVKPQTSARSLHGRLKEFFSHSQNSDNAGENHADMFEEAVESPAHSDCSPSMSLDHSSNTNSDQLFQDLTAA